MSRFNHDIVKRAWAELLKTAFVPGDPSGGGGDPSGGGAPPPDPSGGGGAPPPDPSAGGGAPPPPPAPPPDASGVGGGPPGGDIAAQVAQGVQQAMATSGMMGQGPGTGKPTAPKPDINTVATDIFQLKKMFLHFLRIQNIELPPDILDGPNRDPQTGAPAFGQAGGSDAAPGSSAVQAGGTSAIKPIQPMQGASPALAGGGGMGGGMGKMSEDKSLKIGERYSASDVMTKVAAAAMLLRRRIDLGDEYDSGVSQQAR